MVGKRRVNRASSLPRDTEVCGQCRLVAARAKVTAGKDRVTCLGEFTHLLRKLAREERALSWNGQ